MGKAGISPPPPPPSPPPTNSFLVILLPIFPTLSLTLSHKRISFYVQWPVFWSGSRSQTINCNCCFCDSSFFICFLHWHWCVVFRLSLIQMKCHALFICVQAFSRALQNQTLGMLCKIHNGPIHVLVVEKCKPLITPKAQTVTTFKTHIAAGLPTTWQRSTGGRHPTNIFHGHGITCPKKKKKLVY